MCFSAAARQCSCMRGSRRQRLLLPLSSQQRASAACRHASIPYIIRFLAAIGLHCGLQGPKVPAANFPLLQLTCTCAWGECLCFPDYSVCSNHQCNGGLDRRQVRLRRGDQSWDSFLARGSGRAANFQPLAAEAGDTTNVLFSSGTTGALHLDFSIASWTTPPSSVRQPSSVSVLFGITFGSRKRPSMASRAVFIVCGSEYR